MILKTKDEILSWLEKYDHEYQDKIKKNTYELIDLHDDMNQALFNEMIKKDNLPFYYFQKLKSEGHQYIVNAKGDVNICNQKLEKIPFQFYHVDGSFNCANNQLRSLKGFPILVSGNFFCQYNQITSLQYGPSTIKGGLYCYENKLTSLKGCPQYVGDNFFCAHNQLTSLEYCPQSIGGNFDCYHNPLTSLEYFPEKINGNIFLNNNEKLLKYKKDSNDIHIQNMSDDDFLNQRAFAFWKQFYLKEKIEKENTQIMDNLNLDEKNHSIKPKIMKV